ncbi:uncharacterized protein LOC102809305 [Saccoglossus kowalevskii]|uniref:Uncharacterized protein LOC102809305 n=1 Tax=Saccoglossus kowalevskii TaxID=10224 RepID=A0ABM0MGM9_SACKO|nr:PREDICTED: uncharacterized protein LOC102809305 [Saccoglossus kowalevskii]
MVLLMDQVEARRRGRPRTNNLPICPLGATSNDLNCSPAGAQRGGLMAFPSHITGKRFMQALYPRDDDNQEYGDVDDDILNAKQGLGYSIYRSIARARSLNELESMLSYLTEMKEELGDIYPDVQEDAKEEAYYNV